MNLIITLVIGFIIGLVARALVPGSDRSGFIVTTILGIAGAFLARYIGLWSSWYGPEDSVGFISSVIGAVIILVVYRAFFRSGFPRRNA